MYPALFSFNANRAQGSIRQTRRFVEIGSISQLPEHEISDIGTGDLEFYSLVRTRKAVTIFAAALSVREGRRTDNRPVQRLFLTQSS